jgi:ketosteroid isomerase-like protein
MEGSMNKAKYLFLLAASVSLLPGCDKAGRNDAAPAAQVNIAADEQAINGNNQRWLELIRAKDSAGIAQLYAEDGAVMPANEPAGRGREAIAQWWGRSMQMPGYDLTFETDQLLVSASGDMALDRGTYRFKATPPEGAIDDAGKFVVVWKKVGGDWKVAADIFNSDKPAGGG